MNPGLLPPIILASTSSRRKELLDMFAVPFQQEDPDFDERTIPYLGDPVQYTQKIALEKGLTVKERLQDDRAVIISADTIVFLNGEVFNKPSDEHDALCMLRKLNGNTHQVISGISIIQGDKHLIDFEKTFITFSQVDDAVLQRYISKHSVLNKCGSYSIRHCGNLLVKEIKGSYPNVLGLPVITLQKALLEFGINIWDFVV